MLLILSRVRRTELVMFISPLSLTDTQFITAPLAVDSAKKVTTTSIVLPLELTKTSIMSWVPALQSCIISHSKDMYVYMCILLMVVLDKADPAAFPALMVIE